MKIKGKTLQEQIDYLKKRIQFNMHEMGIPRVLVKERQMTPQDKLKEIKEGAKVCSAALHYQEWNDWLIARVEQLEQTLKEFADVDYPASYKDSELRNVAREALNTGPKPE